MTIPTTAIAIVLVGAVAATVTYMKRLKPEPRSRADNAAGAFLAIIGFPLATVLMLERAWAELAVVTIILWFLTVGTTKGRERVIWTVGAWAGTALLVWMARNH